MLMAATSGRRLHQTLLEIVIGSVLPVITSDRTPNVNHRAPLSFFAKNNIGMTLNR